MKHIAIAAAVLVAVAATPAEAVTSVAANLAVPTSLGFFAAGTYQITATGLIDLVGPVPSGFTIRPDGVPDSPIVTPPYDTYFNPSGSYTADGSYGPGGTTIKIGALMGTLTAIPLSPADYFLIGYGTTVTLGSAGSIYAQVNDTFYPNNGGAFQVEVTAAAVPEPASWAMMIVGFGVVGAAKRRRIRTAVRFA